MNYGFLIDNRKCIGCHACTTACKAENQVPLGVNRTWVKYTEKGIFPNTRRYFQVTRCNHCANPPCVHICPVQAMYQRKDGIVEFDPNLCIGCKACLQACPYDAIYIDPESHTAAKCHFCAHRTEVGLEPACVSVCPEHAIIAGDLEDANSEIAQFVASQPVRVRKPEQGTMPRLFYIEGEEVSLTPTLARQDSGMLWATLPENGHGEWRGPIQIGDGNMAGALLHSAAAPRETYNVPHKIPWHWQVPAYLVTKAIGAGMFIVAASALALGLAPETPWFTSIAAFLSLVFIGLTTLLLVLDLTHPERFFSIVLRPQWKSWLARGAFVLIGFTAVGGLVFLGYAAAQLGIFPAGAQFANALILPGIVLAILAAIYTAFLFAQANGRDLWQSALLPWHLFVQAIMAGTGALLVLVPFTAFVPPVYADAPATIWLAWTFAASLVVNLFLTVMGEFYIPHATQVAAAAAHIIMHGKYKTQYWFSIIGGLVVPIALVVLFPTAPFALALAGILAIAGLFAYEYAFVMAPQQVPNN
ncbi:MAG: polysulfide reductase NrfD [Chloroflexi bacterium]|nr:polysulfide reductase NrfD [Chloroflexota bacterium]